MKFLILAFVLYLSFGQRLTVDVYIESLCPYCMNFIKTSLQTAIQTPRIEEMVHIRLIPYGNTKRSQDSKGQWTFTCQHGAAECYGDVIELCAQNRVNSIWSGAEIPIAGVVHCIETQITSPYTNAKFDSAVKFCSTQYKYDADDVIKCANNSEGVLLHLIAADETDNLIPKHLGVPWPVANRKFEDDSADAISEDLLGWACDNYTGEKIPACYNRSQ